MFDIRDYIVEEKTKYRSRLNRLTKDPESFFEFGFNKTDYDNYLNHFTAKAAQESIGLNKSFTPNLSAMDDLIDNRDEYIEKYGNAGYNSLYSARLSQARGDIEKINKAMKWKGTKFTSDVLNSSVWLKDRYVYDPENPEDMMAQSLGYAPAALDQKTAKAIIAEAKRILKTKTKNEHNAIQDHYAPGFSLTALDEIAPGNRPATEAEIKDAMNVINEAYGLRPYLTPEQQQEEHLRNMSIPYPGAPSNGHFSAQEPMRTQLTGGQPGLNDKSDEEKETEQDDEKKEEPVKLYYPETDSFDDYINREDYDNAADYYNAVAQRFLDYINNGDEEGFKEFSKENNFDPFVMSYAREYIEKNRKKQGNEAWIVAGNPATNNAGLNPHANLSERGYSSTHSGGGQGDIRSDEENKAIIASGLADADIDIESLSPGELQSTADKANVQLKTAQNIGNTIIKIAELEEQKKELYGSVEITAENWESGRVWVDGRYIGHDVKNIDDQIDELKASLQEDYAKCNPKIAKEGRRLEVQASPSNNAVLDGYYIVYGKRPTYDEFNEMFDRWHKQTFTEEDLEFYQQYFKPYIDNVYVGIRTNDPNTSARINENIADILTQPDFGENQIYRDKYKEVYGKEPTTQDLIDLSNRIKVAYPSAYYKDKPQYKRDYSFKMTPEVFAVVRKYIDNNKKYLDEHGIKNREDWPAYIKTCKELDEEFRKLSGGKTTLEVLGKLTSDLTDDDYKRFCYNPEKLLDEKDRLFLSHAGLWYVINNTRDAALDELRGEDTSGWLQTVTGAGGKGVLNWSMGVDNALLWVVEHMGGSLIDNNVIGRFRNYANTKVGEANDEISISLRNAPDYQEWMSTAQDTVAGAVEVGLDLMAGKILGSLGGGTTMLSNPAIKPTLIQTIAPNAATKVLLVRSFGDKLVKYEDMGVGGFAPLFAMSEAVVNTWIEGMGGIYGPDSVFAQGAKNIPKGFLKKLGYYWVGVGENFAEETVEEGLQSAASSGFEVLAGSPIGKITFMQEFGTPEAVANTELSVLLTVSLFGLGGLHSSKVNAITEAYEQGNFKEAARLTIEANKEAKKNKTITGEDARIFDLINEQLVLYVGPNGQVSPINPNDLEVLPPSTGVTENVQLDQTIDNNEGNMLQYKAEDDPEFVKKVGSLDRFATENEVDDLRLSTEEILKQSGGRTDLAESLILATKEIVPGKTVPELVGVFNILDSPAPGSLSTYKTRIWYLYQESMIKSKLDYSKPLEQVARDAFNMRNQIRTQAREYMKDRAWAEYLKENDKNKTFEQMVRYYNKKGYTGDSLWNKIIESSTRSRDSVNKLFGIILGG